MTDFIDRPVCPRCGSTLITNGSRVWCSYVGSHRWNERPCMYGIDSPVEITPEAKAWFDARVKSQKVARHE